MELTMAERRDYIELLTRLVRDGVVKRSDMDAILSVCMAACNREMANLKEDETHGLS